MTAISAEAKQRLRGIFDRVVELLEHGDGARAEAILASTLREIPNEPNLTRMLGVALLRQGRAEEAAAKLDLVTRLVPHFAEAYVDLANALMAQCKVDEAVAALKTALKHNPNFEAAAFRLAEVLTLAGRGEDADRYFELALEMNPQRRRLVEGMEHERAGRTSEAEKIYRAVVRETPDSVDALRLLGTLYIKQKNFNDAEALLRRAVELAPNFVAVWNGLGTALHEQQKFAEARACYEKAIALNPDNPNTHGNLASTHTLEGNLDAAVDSFRRAIALEPRHFPSLLGLGHVLKTLGRQEEAIDAYRRCADIRPAFGEVFWSLANLKTFRFDEREVAVMEHEISGENLREDDAIAFAFALAKAHEDRGDYSRAFDYYRRGNEKKRAATRYDPLQNEVLMDRLIEVFDADFIKSRAGVGDDDASPILVVGLPRSGSTLLEQILSSHSEIEGTSELPYLGMVGASTGLHRGDNVLYPKTIADLGPKDFVRLGRDYIEHTLPHRRGSPYFIDKMPNNFAHVGFLHLILPNAKIIDARRHPLDSCLGTYKQLFAKGQVFSYDLVDLAEYYKQYVRIMKHWDAVLPGKVLRVQYEDVVADVETEARRILEHCGLEWEDAVLRFYETERAVKTASSEQVRRPIYSSAVHFWRHYEEELGSLVDDLEPVLRELPQSDWPAKLLAP